jgi:hypothetical protein
VQCRCTACGTVVADPLAKVTVTTRREAGTLSAKMYIPLATYTNEPVRVRLDDTDTTPIAEALLGSIPPKGRAPFKQWRFKTKAPGVQQFALRDKGTGQLQLTVRAKKWFSAAAANQAATGTTLTVTIGGQCLSHVVTKKTD